MLGDLEVTQGDRPVAPTVNFVGATGRSPCGFTLLEILIALFIFTIIALIMTKALHSVFSTSSTTELHAQRLEKLQLTLLLFEHDTQQLIDRPITNQKSEIEPTLIGTATSINFTRGGFINPSAQLQRSTLQRVAYTLTDNTFIRKTWPVLDQVATTKPSPRKLLPDVTELQFEYLDTQKNFINQWPPPNQNKAILPLAIRITLTLKHWGKITELYQLQGKNLGQSS